MRFCVVSVLRCFGVSFFAVERLVCNQVASPKLTAAVRLMWHGSMRSYKGTPHTLAEMLHILYKVTKLAQLPPYLLVQLKRFAYA